MSGKNPVNIRMPGQIEHSYIQCLDGYNAVILSAWMDRT